MKDKLKAAKELTHIQLKLKHIEESYSPWNSPIFVIKKKLTNGISEQTLEKLMHL